LQFYIRHDSNVFVTTYQNKGAEFILFSNPETYHEVIYIYTYVHVRVYDFYLINTI